MSERINESVIYVEGTKITMKQPLRCATLVQKESISQDTIRNCLQRERHLPPFLKCSQYSRIINTTATKWKGRTLLSLTLKRAWFLLHIDAKFFLRFCDNYVEGLPRLETLLVLVFIARFYVHVGTSILPVLQSTLLCLYWSVTPSTDKQFPSSIGLWGGSFPANILSFPLDPAGWLMSEPNYCLRSGLAN